MRRLLLTALGLGLLSAGGCRIEDYTPTGSRRDEEAIQALVNRYALDLSNRNWNDVRGLFWRDASYSGPMVPRSVGRAVPIDSALAVLARRVEGSDQTAFDVRVLRTDFRQESDLAAVWVIARRRVPLPGAAGAAERDWVEHLVLRRIGGSWRILSVAGASAPRGASRDHR
ncbi:MAG: nuclear transport factor 2 family protein [Gemmatimonadales bacterium]